MPRSKHAHLYLEYRGKFIRCMRYDGDTLFMAIDIAKILYAGRKNISAMTDHWCGLSVPMSTGSLKPRRMMRIQHIEAVCWRMLGVRRANACYFADWLRSQLGALQDLKEMTPEQHRKSLIKGLK